MTDDVLDTMDALRNLKVGDFMDCELPPDVIASIEKLTDAFARGRMEEKLQIVSGVNYTFSFAFFCYAGRAAVESVRNKRPDLLRRGLWALAIENCTFDARDSLLVIVRIYHSARKLTQIYADEFLEEVASTSCTPFSTTLAEFVRRPDDMKSLARFGLRESSPPAPFDYEPLPKRSRFLWRNRVRTSLKD